MDLFRDWDDQVRGIADLRWEAHRSALRVQVDHRAEGDMRRRIWIHSERAALLILPLRRDFSAAPSSIEPAISEIRKAITSCSSTPAEAILRIVGELESQFEYSRSGLWSARAFLTIFCGDDNVVFVNMGAGGAFVGNLNQLVATNKDVRMPQLIKNEIIGPSDIGEYVFKNHPLSSAMIAVGNRYGYEVAVAKVSRHQMMLICDNESLPFNRPDSASCRELFAADAGWKNGRSSTTLWCGCEGLESIDVPPGWQIESTARL